MAEVFLVMDRFRRREVALKVMHARWAPAEHRAMIERLWMNEMRLAGRLKHPYVLEVHEAGTCEDGATFLVMEFAAGGTLRAHAAPATLLEVPRVADIVFKLCHALEYANTQGLLHRDVKPENVLLTAQGTPKVADFGAAYASGADVTQVIRVGTLPFLPPEHFEGAEPGIQHDIYAVGMTAYNLLTGVLPYRGASQAEIIEEKLHGDPMPIEFRRAGVPEALRRAVERALHRSPRRRFHTWKGFRDAISDALPGPGRAEAMSESSRFEALRRLAFFRDFSETAIWEAVHISTSRRFPAGHEVFAEDADDTTIYVVEEGEVEVRRRGVPLVRVVAGEVFGELAFLEGTERPRTASAHTLAPTRVSAFHPAGVRSASKALQVALGRAMVRQLVRRVVDSNERLAEAMIEGRGTGAPA